MNDEIISPLKGDVFFVSLGCDKNLVDSETMLGLLRDAGYGIVSDEALAQVVVINTCSFILDAQDESVQTILEMAQLKVEGRLKALIVTGCLSQRFKEDILKEIPEVDAVLGTASYYRIAEVADRILQGETGIEIMDDLSVLPQTTSNRILTTGAFSSYLKIAEGCDKHCTYCIIPSLRGHYRSYPVEYLIRQASYLAGQGVKELNLVAQETTVYGQDLYGHKALPELLSRLCEIEGIEWIRILYCYPEEITPELVAVIKEQPKICHYLDLPIQHCSDRVLKRMGRRTDEAQIRSIVAYLREEIPDIALRTTLIAGFPGETEEDHQRMRQFITELRFDRLGCFAYSREDGTPAAIMEDQIEEALKEERRDALMLIQQEIAFEKAREMEGREVEVLIEGYLPEDRVYIGRTYKDAPDVDGYVFVYASAQLMSGDIVSVMITDAKEYDLIGVMKDESAE